MTPFIFATTFAEYSDVLCVRVVGGGECGKSTIVKQMKYVHSLSSAVLISFIHTAVKQSAASEPVKSMEV